MNSIRTKTALITVIAIVLAMGISTYMGMNAVRSIGRESTDQILLLLCETGENNLDHYFQDIEQSVKLASTYVETDLQDTDMSEFHGHMDRVREVFNSIARQQNGILTYYYRIDPEFSKEEKGFWYVDSDGRGFREHAVTEISAYDTEDTSSLVWFTVPKTTGKPVWLPPYRTENLDVLVLSYNVPVYKDGRFVGVVGIELDYTMMADQVNSIRPYDHGYAFINDKEGNIIYHPNIDVSELTDENKPKAPEGLLSDEKFIQYEYEGVEKQAVWLELKNGMRLNVTVPMSEINGNWKSLINKTVLVLVALLLVFVLIVLQFTGRIIRPLRKLTKAAEQVSEGDYDVEIDVHGNDEVGVLARSFRKLVGNIKTYISDLNRLNDHLKEDNLTLEAATTRDSLTGVRNRFALRRDYELYNERDIHIMMVDIDDFKKVNDTYGHSVGDFLLKKMGDSLLEIFGYEYSYRYGGDEFLVIVPDLSEEDFRESLERMKSELEKIRLNNRDLPVHFSAGYVYGKTVLQDDLRLMLRQADSVLYETKAGGKHGFRGCPYDREMAIGLKKHAEEDFRRG